MEIEKARDGSYRISKKLYGALFIKDYYFYTRKEAISLFRQAYKERKVDMENIIK